MIRGGLDTPQGHWTHHNFRKSKIQSWVTFWRKSPRLHWNLSSRFWKKAKNQTLGCGAFKELIITTPGCYYSLTFITVWITVKAFVYSELVLIRFLPWNRVLHYLSLIQSLKQCLGFPSHQGSQMYGKNPYLNRICKFLTFIRISFLVTL